MTQAPAPDPAQASAKVAELEKQLADAAANVAKVQAELSNARAADPNHPQVPVPYAGHAPVVMINGQQVPAGQAIDVSAMLGGMFGGLGAAAGQAGQVVSIPPVVTVNGQVVSGGQPVDLATIVGAENLAHIRQSLDQLGLGGQLAGLFGPVATGPASPSPPYSGGTTPGPAPGVYSTTPGEITRSGNAGLWWLVVAVVVGIVGVVAYLALTQ